MKRKFSKILGVGLALALALSLVIMAVPTAADSPADTDVGFELGRGDTNDTAEWSTTMAGETGAMGSYSVKLVEDGTNPGNDHVKLIPPSGITVSDLEALTNDWGFWYHLDQSSFGPYLELKFTSGTDYIDITIMRQTSDLIYGEWTEVVLATSTLGVQYYGSVDSSEVTYGGSTTLQAALIALEEESESWSAVDWELTRVLVQLWEDNVARTCYVDDITIDGTTYELEPIFLDAEYYSVADTIEVTVPNFKANSDSIRINPVTADTPAGTETDWEVTVTSNSDAGGTTVALEETGANTGVFTGSFNTTDTSPAGEDELYVQDGDTITVTYDLTGDWGTGADQSADLTLTASVDDSAPDVTVVSPLDDATTDNAKPEIKASYSDTPAGIDQTSVEMLVNGVEVDATVGASSVTYTPDEDLDEGSHDVTVNVSDNAGNEATESWSFRIASWLVEPVSGTDVASLDELDTVGVAVSITGDTGDITVGRYASNPQPEAPPAFDMIEDGFFDVKALSVADATQIVIKFADTAITAESTAHVWDDLEGAWLECSDQGYNSLDEYLWVKVRDDTTPNIAELEGTPFAISGEPAVSDISAYYQGYSGDAEVVETTDLLKAANDWANAVVPSGFTEAISTTQLLALANEWAATE